MSCTQLLIFDWTQDKDWRTTGPYSSPLTISQELFQKLDGPNQQWTKVDSTAASGWHVESSNGTKDRGFILNEAGNAKPLQPGEYKLCFHLPPLRPHIQSARLKALSAEMFMHVQPSAPCSFVAEQKFANEEQRAIPLGVTGMVRVTFRGADDKPIVLNDDAHRNEHLDILKYALGAQRHLRNRNTLSELKEQGINLDVGDMISLSDLPPEAGGSADASHGTLKASDVMVHQKGAVAKGADGALNSSKNLYIDFKYEIK